jgi:putative colanic acid biosynthesis UDP-glucose lipid carrier transferase
MLCHLAKPGITGWAQVNGYHGETKDVSLMQKRIDHDIWYIENRSFLLDIQIIILTL